MLRFPIPFDGMITFHQISSKNSTRIATFHNPHNSPSIKKTTPMQNLMLQIHRDQEWWVLHTGLWWVLIYTIRLILLTLYDQGWVGRKRRCQANHAGTKGKYSEKAQRKIKGQRKHLPPLPLPPSSLHL